MSKIVFTPKKTINTQNFRRGIEKIGMIEINNLTTNRLDEEFLKKIAQKVLEGEKPAQSKALRRAGEADLSIALVGQGRIRKLNKKYLGKNKTTDVLAFPGNGLGEIVICLREVKKNAQKYGSTFEKELARVLIHGILHLLDYDHEEGKPGQSRALRRARQNTKFLAGKMEEKENYYLSII